MRRTIYVADVLRAEGVRFATIAQTREQLQRELGEYIRRCASDQLWPDDARAVSEAMARADYESAIERYFGAVGDRWDNEWLVTQETQQ